MNYPWNTWSDGKPHRIEKGIHYSSLQALRGAATSQGLRRKGKYSIRQVDRGYDDAVYIQFTKYGEPASQPRFIDLNLRLVERIIKLVHPDRQPPERSQEATSVTQELMEIRDKLRKKAK